MFDCVYPTRTARFGTALVSTEGGQIKLKSAACARDVRPIAWGCACEACAGGYTRAHLCESRSRTVALGLQIQSQGSQTNSRSNFVGSIPPPPPTPLPPPLPPQTAC